AGGNWGADREAGRWRGVGGGRPWLYTGRHWYPSRQQSAKITGWYGDDMGSFPWGPHGPEVSPHSVKPNPTAAQPVGPLGGAEQGGAFPMGGAVAGTGSGGPLLSIAVSLC